MENKNNKIVWYVLGALVLVLLLGGLYFVFMKSDTQTVNTNQSDNTAVENTNDNNDDGESTNGVDNNQEVDANEQARLNRIEGERAALLAEQIRIEAQTNASSTESDSQVSAERQQEIQLELLELQNQEEYPPLNDPGE